MNLSKDKLLQLYETMQLIRHFELTVQEEFAKGTIPGFVHLYAGQEAVAAGVCAHLRADDFIASNHRGHGHCIAKGCSIDGMMAEIFGRATGLCKGKGGSMHIADIDRGMLGANGIVGGGLPLATGAALSAKTRGTDQVSVCFFGDGTVTQGVFHECLNMAAIWQLPVIFVCENNRYAEATPIEYAWSGENIAGVADTYGIPGAVVDGQDVLAVYAELEKWVSRARSGGGPALVECETYRFFGHFEGDTQTYKKPSEAEVFQEHRDPLLVFSRKTKDLGITEAELQAVEHKARDTVAAALEFALASPWPDESELLEDVFVPS